MLVAEKDLSNPSQKYYLKGKDVIKNWQGLSE
jgi:hypothetical protein